MASLPEREQWNFGDLDFFDSNVRRLIRPTALNKGGVDRQLKNTPMSSPLKGERRRRDSKEDSAFDKKFKELKREITSRIFNQVEASQRARESIQVKFDKINSKIDSILELQNTVTLLRNDLHNTENTLIDIIEKVEKLENAGGEAYSLRSRKSSRRSTIPIFEEEICDVTHKIGT